MQIFLKYIEKISIIIFILFFIALSSFYVFSKYIRTGLRTRVSFDGVIATGINILNFIPNQYWPYPINSFKDESGNSFDYGVVTDIEEIRNIENNFGYTIKLKTFGGGQYEAVINGNVDYFILGTSFRGSDWRNIATSLTNTTNSGIKSRGLIDSQFVMYKFDPIYINVGDIVRLESNNKMGLQKISSIYSFGSYKYFFRRFYQ